MRARASRSGRATTRRCRASPTSSSAPTARAVRTGSGCCSRSPRSSPTRSSQRFAAADRRIRNRGMSYRVQGEAAERIWPLSRMPLLIPEAEWREIERGVIQRAELIERVLADVYGEGRLVAEGAAAGRRVDRIAPTSSPPCAASTPPGGRWLRLYAADIGRGPDGRWWVLGDRGQAPSGLRLRAGEPAGRVAGLLQPLQPDERRAPGAVLPRPARRPARRPASAASRASAF